MKYPKTYHIKVDTETYGWLKSRTPDFVRQVLMDYKDGKLLKRGEEVNERLEKETIAPSSPSNNYSDVKCNARFFRGTEAYCKTSRDKKPRKLVSPEECKTCYKVWVVKHPSPQLKTTNVPKQASYPRERKNWGREGGTAHSADWTI